MLVHRYDIMKKETPTQCSAGAVWLANGQDFQSRLTLRRINAVSSSPLSRPL